MPFFQYILVALMGGSATTGSLPVTPPGLTLGPDAIVQPTGGVMIEADRHRHDRHIRRGKAKGHARHIAPHNGAKHKKGKKKKEGEVPHPE